MRSIITKLNRLLAEGGNSELIEGFEEAIAESLASVVNDDLFYALPIKEVQNIVSKSEMDDLPTMCKLASNMSKKNRENAALLLNVFNPKYATLEECIRIIANFEYCPLCIKIGELYADNSELPERDYEHDIEKLEKENIELKKKILIDRFSNASRQNSQQRPQQVKQQQKAQETVYEKNIFVAAKKGDLRSVKYLVETAKVNVNVRNEYDDTVLHEAVKGGNMGVIKYLVETCKLNPNVKGFGGYTALHNATDKSLEIVKYLVEVGRANPELGNKYLYTPLHTAIIHGKIDIVKYLIKNCKVNIESKSDDGTTPLHSAVINGKFEIVKYLIEDCHANTKTKDYRGRNLFKNKSSYIFPDDDKIQNYLKKYI